MSVEPEVDAVVGRAVALANSIIQGEIDSYPGAKRLWGMHNDLDSLASELRTFVGLASEWEDAPKWREQYERDIVVAADRFRARFGP